MTALTTSIFSPRASRRPALACEIAPEGILAARRATDGSTVTAFTPLAAGLVTPALAAPNFADPEAVVTALRKVLDDAAAREKSLTLIIPDAAVRVLLIDFDTLPAKPQEAMPILRFRLRKLVPFDADEAALSYQILSRDRNLTRVLAAVTPSSVRTEYESAVRAAGYVPGALLSSTLAALAALDSSDPSLVLSRSGRTATTVIAHAGDLLLHRSLELPADREAQQGDLAEIVSVSAAYFEDTLHHPPAALHYAGPGGASALACTLGPDLTEHLTIHDLAPALETGNLTAAPTISTAAVMGALAS